MGRTKRAIDLAIRVAFILLCFVVTYLFNAFAGLVDDNADFLTREDRIQLQLKGDAQATYTVEDGEVILDVQKAGSNYDDIALLLSAKSAFNTELIRKSLGDSAADYEKELAAMENGPWTGKMYYVLSGDKVFTTQKGEYTFVDGDSVKHTQRPSSKSANTRDGTDEMTFEKDQGITAAFILGSEETGPLPAGKYTLSAHVILRTADGSLELPFAARLAQFGNVTKEALSTTSFGDLFKVSSLLTFYGAMCAFCFIFFGYQDLRSSLKLALIAARAGGPVVTYTVKTYINGVFEGSEEYTDTGFRFMIFVLVFILLEFLFVITIPLRLLIIIIKDIYHIIADDPDEEGFSIFGNILGSFGFYALIFGAVQMVMSQYVVGGIVLAIALALLIFAGKLCKKYEEYWV